MEKHLQIAIGLRPYFRNTTFTLQILEVGWKSYTCIESYVTLLCFPRLHSDGLMVPESLHQQDTTGRPAHADFTVLAANYLYNTWPFPCRGGWGKKKSELHFHSN